MLTRVSTCPTAGSPCISTQNCMTSARAHGRTFHVNITANRNKRGADRLTSLHRSQRDRPELRKAYASQFRTCSRQHTHLPRDFSGDELHQWYHPLIRVIVAADDPYHADSVHHRWQCIEDDAKRALVYIFEVALQSGEKPGRVEYKEG